MIRLLLIVTTALALASLLTLAAIILYPRADDMAMRAFFAAPDGCSAPCFLGIRPGVTPQSDALALLRAHPWIENVVTDGDGFSWTWNGKQPAFVSSYNNALLMGHIGVQSGIVQSIRVTTTTIWADFYTLFGPPDHVNWFTGNTPSRRFQIYDATYLDPDFEIETATQCPITSRQASWYSMVLITWPISGPVYFGDPSRLC